MKDLSADLSWWNLLRGGNTTCRKTSAFNHLFHAKMPFPPAISPHSLSPLQHLWQGASTWQPGNSGDPPEQNLSLLSTEIDEAVRGKWFKIHQNASEDASKCFCIRAQTRVTYTALLILNFQSSLGSLNLMFRWMNWEKVKPSQCRSQLDGEEILQAEVSIRWRKLTGNKLKTLLIKQNLQINY